MTDDEWAAFVEETKRRYIRPLVTLAEYRPDPAETPDESLADAAAFRAANRP